MHFFEKDLVISTRKKRIFVDFEDDDDDDDNESNSQHEDIEKIDLQNLKVEKNDDENNFNRYQNEDALQTMDDNKNGNYYYGLNDNNSTPLIYTARKGLRKHIFSSPENDNQSMEKENLQNENSSKSTQINDNSSPLSVNGVRHTSEKKSGGVETSRICKSLKFLSDSDDEDIDAKFSSLSDRLSKRADVINNIRFDLLKTESVTTKLIDTTNKSPTLTPSNMHVKCSSDNTKEFTAAQWKKIKHEYTEKFYAEFNRTVFDCQLPFDLQIDWSVRLNKTAGLTYTNFKPVDQNGDRIRHARIELSTKVLDQFTTLKSYIIA